jgi:hypothetical protein
MDREQQAHNHYVISNPYDVPYVLALENGKKMTLHANSEITFSLPAEVRELKVNISNLHTYEFETLEVAIQLPE